MEISKSNIIKPSSSPSPIPSTINSKQFIRDTNIHTLHPVSIPDELRALQHPDSQDIKNNIYNNIINQLSDLEYFHQKIEVLQSIREYLHKELLEIVEYEANELKDKENYYNNLIQISF